MTKKVDQAYFKQPVKGTDPITKGHFTIDWAFIKNYWNEIDEDDLHIGAMGQITIDGKDTNPFYEALIKTPLLIQDHPLSAEFTDGMRFIKINGIGYWDNQSEFRTIRLHNVEFEFLDNLNYLESITDFRDTNLL